MTARQLALVCLFPFTSAMFYAARPPAAPPATSEPLEVELLSRVTSRNVTAGSRIFARATLDWIGRGCALTTGAAVEGTVTAAVPHGPKSHQSELAFSFTRAQCGGADLRLFRFRIAAVAAPPDPELSSLTANLPTPVEPGLHPVDWRTESSTSNVPRFPSDARLRAGEILGIPGIRLTLGKGSDQNAVFTRSGYDVALEEHTRLLLLPVSDAAADPAAGAPISDDLPSFPAPAAELPSTSVSAAAPEDASAYACASPNCTAGLLPQETIPEQKFLGSISLAALGFSPRVDAVILDTTPDEVLAWLGPAQLLITFNPHPLIPRHNDRSDGCVRVIRAVLIDTSTHRLLRTMEWRILDGRQFLWTLPQNRVLVHVGNELRVYGTGMTLERRIQLGGPLAFTRVSPDGNTIAIGVVRERHAPQLHELLALSLHHDPDENVEVLVMNEQFEILARSASTSEKAVPVLLNQGQVSIRAGPERGVPPQRIYKVEMRRWDNVAVSLGQFASTCSPALSTIAPNLLFLVTCDTFNGAREYRVMRPDGATILHGHSLLRDLGHHARADSNGNTFAIRVFRADQPLLPGESFHAADLESVDLTVYKATDGKKLYTVRMKGPAASTDGYAVSSSGQLAVLAEGHVELYTIPRN